MVGNANDRAILASSDPQCPLSIDPVVVVVVVGESGCERVGDMTRNPYTSGGGTVSDKCLAGGLERVVQNRCTLAVGGEVLHWILISVIGSKPRRPTRRFVF